MDSIELFTLKLLLLKIKKYEITAIIYRCQHVSPLIVVVRKEMLTLWHSSGHSCLASKDLSVMGLDKNIMWQWKLRSEVILSWIRQISWGKTKMSWDKVVFSWGEVRI